METREDDAGFPVAECDCGSRLQVDELEERGVVQI